MTTSMDSQLFKQQFSNLKKEPEHQIIKISCQRENQYPSRDMEILIHVKNDITTFVKKVKEKVNNETQSEVWLPTPQYIDFFQKIKYAFNLLGKISSHQDELIRTLVMYFFESLEYVTYYCPAYKTLPKQVNCPLLTEKAINLLKTNLKEKNINYWKEFGPAWTVARAFWPKSESEPPAYTPTFYDGWQLPEVNHLELFKIDANNQAEQQNGEPGSSGFTFPRLCLYSSPLESPLEKKRPLEEIHPIYK